MTGELCASVYAGSGCFGLDKVVMVGVVIDL